MKSSITTLSVWLSVDNFQLRTTRAKKVSLERSSQSDFKPVSFMQITRASLEILGRAIFYSRTTRPKKVFDSITTFMGKILYLDLQITARLRYIIHLTVSFILRETHIFTHDFKIRNLTVYIHRSSHV